MNNQKIVVYGHHHCRLALMLEEALTKHQIQYEWRDVEIGEPSFQHELRKLARGHLSVPTVIFPDGTVMVEPFPQTVLRRVRRV